MNQGTRRVGTGLNVRRHSRTVQTRTKTMIYYEAPVTISRNHERLGAACKKVRREGRSLADHRRSKREVDGNTRCSPRDPCIPARMRGIARLPRVPTDTAQAIPWRCRYDKRIMHIGWLETIQPPRDQSAFQVLVRVTTRDA